MWRAGWMMMLALSFTVGCGDDSDPADGGATDAGSLDTGGTDAAGTDGSGEDGAGLDTTTGTDGSPSDSATADRGLDAAPDSGGSDANDGGTIDTVMDGSSGMCDWDAFVTGRPGTGGVPLMVGNLCDDVFVCVETRAQATAVMRAGPSFDCSLGAETPCGGFGCAYRNPGGPSTLDADELAEICAVTLVEPRPQMTCRIYL